MGIYDNNRFYGRFANGMYFFIWTIIFTIVGIAFNIFLAPRMINNNDFFPLFAKILINCVPYFFAIFFLIPGFVHSRGIKKKKKILERGKLKFGGTDISVEEREIVQDNAWTMFKSHTIFFEFQDSIVDPTMYIAQYVRPQNASRIASVPYVPVRVYLGEPVFDEDTFEQMTDEDFKVIKLLEIYKNSSRRYSIEEELEDLDKYDRWNDERIKFPEQEKQFIDSLYERIKAGGLVKITPEEMNHFWDLMDDESHDYTESNKAKCIGGFILYAKSGPGDLFVNSLTSIIEAAKDNNPVAYRMLGSIFDENIGKPFVPFNKEISSYCYSLAYLLNGLQEEKFTAVKPSLDRNSDLAIGALAYNVIKNGYKEEDLLEFAKIEKINKDERQLIITSIAARKQIEKTMKEKGESDLLKYEIEHFEDVYETLFYNYIHNALKEIDFDKFNNHLQEVIKTKK